MKAINICFSVTRRTIAHRSEISKRILIYIIENAVMIVSVIALVQPWVVSVYECLAESYVLITPGVAIVMGETSTSDESIGGMDVLMQISINPNKSQRTISRVYLHIRNETGKDSRVFLWSVILNSIGRNADNVNVGIKLIGPTLLRPSDFYSETIGFRRVGKTKPNDPVEDHERTCEAVQKFVPNVADLPQSPTTGSGNYISPEDRELRQYYDALINKNIYNVGTYVFYIEAIDTDNNTHKSKKYSFTVTRANEAFMRNERVKALTRECGATNLVIRQAALDIGEASN